MKRPVIIIFAFLLFLGMACSKIATDNTVESIPQISQKSDIWLMEDMSDRMVPGEPGSGEAVASFQEEGSKTHTELSSDGTYAQVVWNPNDSFEMLAYNTETGKFPYTVYTTAQGGVNANFTYSNTISLSPCYNLYPGPRRVSTYNDVPIFGITIPITQTATAGSVSPGANVSFCKTNGQVSDFHFLNAASYVKFRLAGSVVSSVTSVSLKGVFNLAGDSMLMVENDGTPVLTQQIYFTDDVTSNTVTLTGSFQTGVDYYFTIFPGTQYGFSMVFSDGTNRKRMVSSTKLELNRNTITDLGTIDIGSELIDDTPDNAILYIEATSGKTPVSIAVVSEGFTQDELGDFELLAKSGIDAMFSVEPFKSYKEYFNVWILKVASNESGASITDGSGNIITQKDTYFESRWGAETYNDMTANLDKVLSFVNNNCPDVINGIRSATQVATLMIINDQRYGGICHSYLNSDRCVGMVPYIGGGQPIEWSYPKKEAANESTMTGGTRSVTNAEIQALGICNGDWRNVMIHEFGGHGFSRLLDEYWYDSYYEATTAIPDHSYPVPYGLNISATYNNPPWQSALLDNLSILQTINPLYSRIGVYHGGAVSIFNRWRSEKISCMIDNRKYFSTWQRMLIVNRILSMAGESFDINNFISKDDPTDPLRDIVSSSTYGSVTRTIPPKVMPMLPAPVFHRDDE